MKRTNPLAIAAVLVVMAMLAANAPAYYHPTLGRWLSRDPVPSARRPARVGAAGPAVGGRFAPRDPMGSQYADGMSLYQYVRSSPAVGIDAFGLRWDDDMHRFIAPDGSLRRIPLPNRYVGMPENFEVSCNGASIGYVEVVTYDRIDDEKSGGLEIQGGFHKFEDTDYTTGKCCCIGLRWIQVVYTNLSKNAEGKWIWGDHTIIDPTPESDPFNEPFYFDTGPTMGQFGQAAQIESNRDVSVIVHGETYSFELGFYDKPHYSKLFLWKEHPKFTAEFELCLVCVRSKNRRSAAAKKEEEGGTIQKLRCVKYGYRMELDGEDVKVRLEPIRDAGLGSEKFDKALSAYGHGWKLDGT